MVNNEDKQLIHEFRRHLTLSIEILNKIPYKALYQTGLTFGALWLFAFFVSTSRLPDLDATTATTLLIGTALGGLLFTAIFIICLMLPSIYLQMIWNQAFGPRKFVISKVYFSSQKAIFSLISFFMLLFNVFLYSAWIYYNSNNQIDLAHHWTTIGLIACAICLFLVRQWYECKYANGANLVYPKNYKLIYLLLSILWFFMCLPLFLLIANPLTQAVAAKETSSAIIQTLDIFLFVLLLFILNQLVISLNDTWTKLIYGLALGLILLIFYLALPGSVSLIKIPFRALSLGNIQHAQIIVTKSTCDYTNAISPSLCKLDKFNTFGLIDDIDISSNIGSEFIIRNSVNQQIFIKKKNILSWSITEPKK